MFSVLIFMSVVVVEGPRQAALIVDGNSLCVLATSSRVKKGPFAYGQFTSSNEDVCKYIIDRLLNEAKA